MKRLFKWIILSSVLLMCLLISFCILAYCVYVESDVSNARIYREVIEAISKGELKPDPSDTIMLPVAYRDASVDGKVFAKRTPRRFIVIFKAWIGKGSNFSGYMYTSAPLSERDVHKDYYNDNANAISLASIEVTLNEKINENWYIVSYTLD